MTIAKIFITSLLVQCALGGDRPVVAPSTSFIASMMGVPEGEAKNAPANIDPSLRRDRGVFWRHSYRILAIPKGTLTIGVMEPRFVPESPDFLDGIAIEVSLQRKFTEANGDICHILRQKINGRKGIVVILQRKAGDWDVLLEYTTDDVVESKHLSHFDDDKLRSHIPSIATEMRKEPNKSEMATPRKPSD